MPGVENLFRVSRSGFRVKSEPEILNSKPETAGCLKRTDRSRKRKNE